MGPTRSEETKARLLEAAAQIYAEKGYRNTRIQDICDRAKANIAAVNYHFGDKQRLYHEVLRYAFRRLTGENPIAWDSGPASAPEERLRAFIHSILTQLLSGGRSALYGKLVTREMADPTPALDRMVEEGIRPQVESLLSIVQALLGPGASKEQVRGCAMSILGQCLFYQFARAVICRVGLVDRLDASVVEALTEQITRFSLAGIRHFK